MLWGLIMSPNKRYTQKVENAFHVSQAALDVTTGNQDPCQLMVRLGPRHFLLGTLQKGKVNQLPLDLNFTSGEEVSFTCNGTCHMHLTGYMEPEDDLMFPNSDDSEVESEEDVPTLVEPKSGKRKVNNENKSNKSKKGKFEVKSMIEDELNSSAQNSSDVEVQDNVTGPDSPDDSDDDEDEANVFEEQDDDDDDDDDEVNDAQDVTDDDDEDDTKVVESPVSKKKKGKQNAENKKPEISQNVPQQNGTNEKKTKKQRKLEREQQQNGVKPAAAKPTAAATTPSTKILGGGVIVEDLKVGTGKPATNGKAVQVYYEGRLKNNNKVFDSSLKGPGFKFNLGKSEVIKGWDIGIAGMKVGGKRRVTCPPHMAYGAKGSPPVIPPKSTLVFEVELLNIH